MSSNSANANTPKTVFEHRDYEKIVSRPNHMVARERRVIKDKLEKSDDGSDQLFEIFDLSRHIKELEKTRNIYFTDESGAIIGYLSEEPDEIIKKKIYGRIGKKICKKYLDSAFGDFQEIMSNLIFELTEIEIRTRNGIVTDINLIDEYDGTDEAEDDKNDSDKKISLPN
jgi:hypothetical protein